MRTANERPSRGDGLSAHAAADALNRLIAMLCAERGEPVPDVPDGQKFALFRALCNVRMPSPAPEGFLALQDAYLQSLAAARGVVAGDALPRTADGLSLWRGDITTLRCDAIVNAANSQMLGCFHPGHGCIDNAIHTYAGVQLRTACAELMRKQGHEEPTGTAKLTPAFNLPSRYVLHTVGPIVRDQPTRRDCALLASCYRACLTLAAAHGLTSVAFCCISTGVFHFPNAQAASIAVQTVRAFLAQRNRPMHVIFNVFTAQDEAIYRALLGVQA